MSGLGTFVITVGVGGAILIGFFLIYYLGSVANNVYELKVQLRREVEKNVKELKEFVDKEMAQRTIWLRGETNEEVKKMRSDVLEELEERFAELETNLNRVRNDISDLRTMFAEIVSSEEMKKSATRKRTTKAEDGTPSEQTDAMAPSTSAPTGPAPSAPSAVQAPQRPQNGAPAAAKPAASAPAKPAKKDIFESF